MDVLVKIDMNDAVTSQLLKQLIGIFRQAIFKHLFIIIV